MNINARLSQTEHEVVKLILADKDTLEICTAMGLAHRTFKFHCTNIYRKYCVGSRKDLFNLLNPKLGYEWYSDPVYKNIANESLRQYFFIKHRALDLPNMVFQLPEGHPSRVQFTSAMAGNDENN